jgi:hypothetical protein
MKMPEVAKQARSRSRRLIRKMEMARIMRQLVKVRQGWERFPGIGGKRNRNTRATAAHLFQDAI